MKIVVPYTTEMNPIIPDVYDALGIKPLFVEMTHDKHYYHLMLSLWEEHEPFIVMEHDLIPYPGALDDLWNCKEVWCGHQVLIGGGYGNYSGFGCTKFGREFIYRTPSIFEQMEHKNWWQLDGQFWTLACEAGFKVHPHSPPVLHLNCGHFPKNLKDCTHN